MSNFTKALLKFHKTLRYLSMLLCALFLLVNCAKRGGGPSGGPKDSIPPAFVKATPPNYTTNFDEEEIRIYFDEYIKLKDYQKQLIISPPLKNSLISPQGSASKFIKITITDTLVPNTTYVFNFGQSIQDNNESNPFSSFKYVMSTGNYIDSLTISGAIIDELSSKPDNFVSVMLYAVDSTLSDSIVFKDPPRYVTNTLDSLTTYEIGNVKEGEYMLIAMKDEDANFTFQPKKDKIGFISEYITIPTDSSYTLKLFKEIPALKTSRPQQISNGHVAFGVEGPIDSLDIHLLTDKPDNFKELWTRRPNQDSLHYWYRPEIAIDSLVFETKGMNYLDTLIMRLRKRKPDSLFFSNRSGRTLALNSPFKLSSSIPITAIDKDLVRVYKDSMSIPFSIIKDSIYSALAIDFERTEKSNFQVQLLPGALTDFFDAVNDTLTYKFQTKEKSDYGGIELILENAKNFPYVVQLTNSKGDVITSIPSTKETTFNFEYLEPGNYMIKLIEDVNGNGLYDTGNYLLKRQPEKVINYEKTIEVRPSWFASETFILKG